jgi:glycosyltransferase involved in cell wall biosynthesis
MVHAVRAKPRFDVAIVMNAANSPFLPLARAAGLPVALHMDGLEWRRGKWGRLGRRYYRTAESIGARWADALVADARGIQAYYLEKHGVDSEFIPYGAPLVVRTKKGLAELGLHAGEYHVLVARFEPENSVELIVRGYIGSDAKHPLVVVGSAPYSAAYTRTIQSLAAGDDRVRLLGAVWDQELLDALYANAATYIHGHTVGGTNPSLLRAMGAGTPVLAIDVVFTREVLGDTGRFFENATDLARLLVESEVSADEERERGERGRQRAAALYDWDQVATDYERLFRQLSTDDRPRRRPASP